jgi:hypothetical protein
VLARSMLTCSLLLLALGVARPASESRSGNDISPFLYTAAESYEPLAWLRGSDRFSSDAAIFVYGATGQHPLVPEFASSADPSVSFDAKRILFAGKARASDPWQIWEVEASGGAPRPITSGNDDCVRPLYLPEERVVYARKNRGRFVIEVTDLSHGKPVALTYIPGNSLPTDVLRDGRILFEAGYPLGTDATPEIYTVYSDGSGVESYRCDHGTARHSAKQSSSGDIVFISSRGLGRFSSASAQQLGVSAPAGEYAGEMADGGGGDRLFSWRPNAAGPFRIVRWREGSSNLEPVLEQRSANQVQPTLLSERAVPNRHPSGLHDWPNANLLCLNAYTSKYHFAADSIRSVRVYTRDSDANRKLLGTAPVEKDGSFFVQVPTEQPLQIELLDAAGRALKREAGFFWMRRGEQRACVGCHAGPETSPENEVPMILLKSTAPSDATGASAARAAGGH